MKADFRYTIVKGLLTVALAFCVPVYGSKPTSGKQRIDSLRTILTSDPKDIESLIQLGMLSLTMADKKTAEECGERLLSLGTELHAEKAYKARTYGHSIMGQVYIQNARPREAYDYLSEARKIAELESDSAALTSIFNGLAIYTYYYVGDIPEAMVLYHKGINCAKASGNTESYYSLMNNLANAHIELGDTLGLPYARQCYDYAVSMSNDWLRYTSSLCLGDTYLLQEDYTRALRFVNEAESLLPNIKGYSPSVLYDLKGRIQGSIGKYEEASENFRKAKAYATDRHDRLIYFMTNEAEMEIDHGRLANASRLLDSVLNMTGDDEDAHIKLKALNLKGTVAEKEGNLAQALEYGRQHADLVRRSTHMRTLRLMSEANARQGLDDMTTELAIQKIATLRHQRNFNIVLIGLIALGAILCGLYYFTYRLRGLHKGLVNQMRAALQREESLKNQIEQLKLAEESRVTITETASPPQEEKPTISNIPTSNIKSSQSIVDAIEKYLDTEKAYRDPNITRDSIAEAIGSNSTYVTRAIQECYNMNLKQFLNNYRIHEAIKILSDPNDDTPLKAIGSAIGYNSITSFYNHFKEATGMTPAAYRTTIKKES